MTIRELLKDYRISQKKTQKQWAKDVISPSFYAKVEKNLSRISAEDLIELLHSNQIPVIDFFSKLNQKDKSINQQELEILKTFSFILSITSLSKVFTNYRNIGINKE